MLTTSPYRCRGKRDEESSEPGYSWGRDANGKDAEGIQLCKYPLMSVTKPAPTKALMAEFPASDELACDREEDIQAISGTDQSNFAALRNAPATPDKRK